MFKSIIFSFFSVLFSGLTLAQSDAKLPVPGQPFTPVVAQYGIVVSQDPIATKVGVDMAKFREMNSALFYAVL